MLKHRSTEPKVTGSIPVGCTGQRVIAARRDDGALGRDANLCLFSLTNCPTNSSIWGMIMAVRREDKPQKEIQLHGYYTCEQAAKTLRMKPDTVRRYVHRGLISAGRIGGVYLISQQQLDAFKSSRKPRGNPNFRKTQK